MDLLLNEDSLIVKLYGDLDHHIADKIRDEIDDLIDKEEPKKLIFDLTNVSFMDSSGIGMIIGRYKKTIAYGGNVYFVGINNCIDKLVQMSGLLRIIPEIKKEVS